MFTLYLTVGRATSGMRILSRACGDSLRPTSGMRILSLLCPYDLPRVCGYPYDLPRACGSSAFCPYLGYADTPTTYLGYADPQTFMSLRLTSGMRIPNVELAEKTKYGCAMIAKR